MPSPHLEFHTPLVSSDRVDLSIQLRVSHTAKYSRRSHVVFYAADETHGLFLALFIKYGRVSVILFLDIDFTVYAYHVFTRRSSV